MEALAVVIEEPNRLSVRTLPLSAPTPADAVVEIDFSGISTGTERMLWEGRMAPFPGMGYPLVPGYESVGRVIEAGPDSGRQVGERVFVPGAMCYGEVRGIFGGAASRIVVPGARLTTLPAAMEEETGTLFALSATAHHAVTLSGSALPDLIVGHGVLGRLIARITVALGGNPVVWEKNPVRMSGADGYQVVDPDEDETRRYKTICDVSGDAKIFDTLVGRLERGGVVVLAGFYEGDIRFAFAPAFMLEARFLIAAQWAPTDVAGVVNLVTGGKLSLDGLITHRSTPQDAKTAYDTAFGDPTCLKMILDWRDAR